MARRHYNLPALSTLAAFEAAARNLSFKNAAQELNVTPGAVSHQVKALERELDATLFERKYRGVVLTSDGLLLFSSLEKAFFGVGATLTQIRKSRIEDVVTIGSTSAVSSLWLTSAVTRFWRGNGHISVNQIVSDSPFAATVEPDLIIRYGRDLNGNLDHCELYRDVLVPVCSPQLATQITDISLEYLGHQRLIHLDADDVRWTSWQSWFSALGYEGGVVPGIRVNNYTIALQAAQDGAGIVLGWKRLIAPLLESGKLVVIGKHVLEAPNRFYIASKPEKQLDDCAVKLRDWLLQFVREGLV